MADTGAEPEPDAGETAEFSEAVATTEIEVDPLVAEEARLQQHLLDLLSRRAEFETRLRTAGFVLGFALQDSLSNFAAGAMILIYEPFDEGDVIEAAGIMGTVSRMSLVSTTILTFDNQTLMVPNNKIWGDVIRNVTAQDLRRVDLVFGVSYSDNGENVERVLYDIITSHEKVLKDPEPMVKLHTLGDSSVNFVVRPWCRTENYWDVYWDLTKEVRQRFEKEGISIPFPQQDVHLIPQGESAT